ncbi:MAG: hypothetical protein ISS79_06945 [Phycisphaerae bacterium]|nr:hypothetical protein [Phycisphaerae bacterium]
MLAQKCKNDKQSSRKEIWGPATVTAISIVCGFEIAVSVFSAAGGLAMTRRNVRTGPDTA